MTIQAVIFDIGNVLIQWQPERFYDAVMPASERAALFAEVDLHAMNDAIDRGAPFRATVYDWAGRYPKWAEHIRLWHDNWFDMASPVIDHSVRLLRALRRNGVPVFALTNFGDDTFANAAPHYDFLAEFDRSFISGRLKVSKPDPRIYEIVENDCGIAPQSLFFTDDRAENIAVARSRGWQVHQFDGAGGLAARLVAEGLLSGEDAR
jgi:2-haloacid dehalogenase